MAIKYPEQYYKFIEQFNEGEYYECHDLLEEIWMEDKANKFLQGLLQVAVAIYHFENGNIYGAKALFTSARKYLERYRPKHWDMNLEPVIDFIEEAMLILPNEHRITIEERKKIPFPSFRLVLDKE